MSGYIEQFIYWQIDKYKEFRWKNEDLTEAYASDFQHFTKDKFEQLYGQVGAPTSVKRKDQGPWDDWLDRTFGWDDGDKHKVSEYWPVTWLACPSHSLLAGTCELARSGRRT